MILQLYPLRFWWSNATTKIYFLFQHLEWNPYALCASDHASTAWIYFKNEILGSISRTIIFRSQFIAIYQTINFYKTPIFRYKMYFSLRYRKESHRKYGEIFPFLFPSFYWIIRNLNARISIRTFKCSNFTIQIVTIYSSWAITILLLATCNYFL